MKALSNFSLTILLSAFVVLPAVSNADNILPPATASTSSTATPTYKEAVLYRFAGGNDGANPQAGLAQGFDGNFYGTTVDAGLSGGGTIFKISTSGGKTTIYNIRGGNDGANPYGGVIQGSDGNLYGTTRYGGTGGGGTVYKITYTGVKTILNNFATGKDGFFPYAGLIQGSDGNLYGTTLYGGTGSGQGTVYKITPQGVKTTLYNFGGFGGDGAIPEAGLIQGSDGNLYGTTTGGGSGYGTVFKVTPQGQGTVLYKFAGGTDGETPRAGLIQAKDGNFYGTTYFGGAGSSGTVYKITPQGVKTTLYSFAGGNDGANPQAGLIQSFDGNFYGTTVKGGKDDNGTVFQITYSGVKTTLYNFTGGTDGANPKAGLLLGKYGIYYGTTSAGGSGNGTVYKIYQ